MLLIAPLDERAPGPAGQIVKPIIVVGGIWREIVSHDPISAPGALRAKAGHRRNDHDVEFRLINAFGDRYHMASAIITRTPSGQFHCETRTPINGDNDGELFPSLEAAVREVAADMVAIEAMPFGWVDQPARRKTCLGGEATAFDADKVG
jgi:hypothetical protein